MRITTKTYCEAMSVRNEMLGAKVASRYNSHMFEQLFRFQNIFLPFIKENNLTSIDLDILSDAVEYVLLFAGREYTDGVTYLGGPYLLNLRGLIVSDLDTIGDYSTDDLQVFYKLISSHMYTECEDAQFMSHLLDVLAVHDNDDALVILTEYTNSEEVADLVTIYLERCTFDGVPLCHTARGIQSSEYGPLFRNRKRGKTELTNDLFRICAPRPTRR